MPWATFLLFVSARLNEQDFEAVRDDVVNLMHQTRRFHRFGAFATELSDLYGSLPADGRVVDLYPTILAWAARQ